MAQDPPPAFGQGYPHGSDGQEPAGYGYQQSWYPQQPPQAQPEPYGDGQHGQQQPWQWQPEPGYYAPYAEPYAEPHAEPPVAFPAQPSLDETPSAETPSAEPSDPQPSDADAPDATVTTTATAEEPKPGRSARSRAGRAPGARSSLVDRAKEAATGVLSADQTPAKRALLLRTAAGVAALGVLLTAGFVATRQSAAPKDAAAAPTDTGFAVAHSKIWSAQPAVALQPGADDTLLGSWLLADAVVRADSTGVHAYDLATGKPTWSVAPPAPGAVPCGLSPTVNATGLGGVLFRPSADPTTPCVLLAAVDSKTGKTAWTKTVSAATGAYAAHVAVTADKVVVVGDDKAAAWAAADGTDAWQYAGQGKFCTLSGSASGATVLLHSACADSTPADQAVALSVADGKVLWWRGLNNQPKTVTVLSAEPAVVLTTGDKPTDAQVFAWGPTGDPATDIPVSTATTRLDVSRGSFDALPGVFFQGHSMITTQLPSSGAGPVVAVAYDLTTGKQLWQTPVSEKGTVRAVGFDNGALVLAADERVGQPAHLSRFAVTGGQEDVGGGFPPDTGSLLSSGRVLTGGGKVIAVPEHSANFGLATAYQAKG